MSGRARRAAKGGKAAAKQSKKSTKKAPSCSLVFQTAQVARITEWLEYLDAFHLGWSSAGAWREVQATLAVLNLDVNYPEAILTDTDFKSIVRRFPALRCLNVPGSLITDAAVRGLSSLKNLRELDITSCAAITAKGIKALPKCLERLGIGYCNDDDPKATDTIVVAAARRCTGLTAIHIAPGYKKPITNATIVEVAKKCVHLKEFHLSWAEQISDRVIIELSNNCDLEDVELQYCTNLMDASLLALAKNCPGLRKLDVSSVKQLTDSSVVALSRCDLLESLNLNDLERVTDSSIVPLITRRGRSLLDLNIGGTLITDASVRAIAQHCGMLKTLTLGCGYWVRSAGSITDAAIIDLASGCPHLRRLTLTSAAITDAFVSGV
jgi:hypothetical protein